MNRPTFASLLFPQTAIRLFRFALRALPAALAASVLVQCTAPVRVHNVTPEQPPGLALKASSATTGALLDTVRNAGTRISRGDGSAIAEYNFAVARLVEELERSNSDPWSAPLAIPGSQTTRTLRGTHPAGVEPLPSQLVPSDTLEFSGRYAQERATTPGLGAPILAIDPNADLRTGVFRMHHPFRILSAVVRFEGSAASLELVDPYQTETVSYAGRRYPLAADYATAIMVGLSKSRVDKLGLVRLLQPARYDDTARLNFLQPYDPKRIPVLFVHGLQDTPASFAPLYFKLIEDPEIRDAYQFWVFSYPSGYPYPYSAMLLRRQLDLVARDFNKHDDMVIVGHSMGGVISRLMVTDAGETIWRDQFGHPPEDTPIGGMSRDLLEEVLIFHERSEIDRAVFISAPHRGSKLASNWIGRFGARLVRLPSFMSDVKEAVISVAVVDPSAMTLKRAPNSIDTLSPNNRFVREVNKLPIAPGVVYHTIAGDRGKGNAPNSSDGVVPYWSSHLEGAASEKMAPSGHMAHQNPEGIEEVRRILLLHLHKR